jgi:hypothetical protein
MEEPCKTCGNPSVIAFEGPEYTVYFCGSECVMQWVFEPLAVLLVTLGMGEGDVH